MQLVGRSSDCTSLTLIARSHKKRLIRFAFYACRATVDPLLQLFSRQTDRLTDCSALLFCWVFSSSLSFPFPPFSCCFFPSVLSLLSVSLPSFFFFFLPFLFCLASGLLSLSPFLSVSLPFPPPPPPLSSSSSFCLLGHLPVCSPCSCPVCPLRTQVIE